MKTMIWKRKKYADGMIFFFPYNSSVDEWDPGKLTLRLGKTTGIGKGSEREKG